MENTFKLRIITPDEVFYEGDAYMVEFNTIQGRIGVYAKHIPMTTVIYPGILKIHEGGKVTSAALISGFVQILKESVTIVAKACERPDQIDEERARQAKVRAQRRLSEKGNIDMARAELALVRALVRLEAKNKH